MQIQVDPDVQAVLEFMQKNIPADKLIGVAIGIRDVAQALWGHNVHTSVLPMSLAPPDISETQLAASG
jgi:hypothetical protein